ncbi:MAG: pseudaminic acid synthase [Gammaproteobacteria bacterium]|nr:pseudaminic acid synthase [Gammaproteobacteria bacterium]
MNQIVRIGKYSVGPGLRPLIIAEMSGNHGGSLQRALAMVDAAAAAGAHALKLQTYTADTMTLASTGKEFVITDPDSPWNGRNLHDLYQEAHTPWEWHLPIFERANQRGMIAFSSPFDESAVDFLETLDVPAYKIASFENTDFHLIRYVAETGKPIIVSTGMATVAEIDECVRACREAGCTQLILLKCTSTYPAQPDDTNILTIPHMRDLFSCNIGLSDHTMGNGVALASVALGATVIEKHFILNRADGGVDAEFSIEPHDLASLVCESERVWRALGSVKYGPVGAETASIRYRRSIFVVEDLKKGDVLTVHNIRRLRPAVGLAAKHYDSILGRPVKMDVGRGTALKWDMLC